MMLDKFRLDNQKKFLIYGAGGNGLKVASLLKSKNYHVLGFIDQRAMELDEVQGESVWTKEELVILKEQASDIVIIITTKNVFEHSKIACELGMLGFLQCIYKPLRILKGEYDGELDKISKTHDSFVKDLLIPNEQELIKVSLEYKLICRDVLSIKEEQEVLAWVPAELLFNYEDGIEYANISMPAFFPLIELYQLFMGEHREEAERILENFFSYSAEWANRMNVRVDESLKKSWLSSRYKSYMQMKSICEYDFDYFLRHAPEVKRGKKGKFHVINSGRNRIAFLLAKGYLLIPVRMSKEDYEAWIHKSQLDVIKEKIERERRNELPNMIPHPSLRELFVEDIDYIKTTCFAIGIYITKELYDKARYEKNGCFLVNHNELNEIWRNYRILCNVMDEGALSRYLDAMDFQVFRMLGESDLESDLDELFYQQISSVDISRDLDFDMIIASDEVGENAIDIYEYTNVETFVYITSNVHKIKEIDKVMIDRKKVILNESFCNGKLKYVVLWKRINM